MTGDLIVQTPQGLYCPAGGFHIDPVRPVARAVITHAHADHARRGHGACLCSVEGAGLLRHRLGAVTLQPLAWGETADLGGVRVSLHPAGHVLGSAQVRIEQRGRVWVVSGDYFVSGAGDGNPTCAPFEPQRCDCFVTESTFALPIYRWRPQREVLAEIDAWWQRNADEGVASLLLGYSVGKAQRLLAGVDAHIGPIVVHDAVDAASAVYRAAGVALPPTQRLAELRERSLLRRALVVAPPGERSGAFAAALGECRVAFASGWMQVRRARSRRSPGRGFVLSDHADWPGLLQAIAHTGAARVIVHHGQGEVLVRWLQRQGLQAGAFTGEPGWRPDGDD